VWLPIPEDEFDVGELMNEPLVAVLPMGHRLADKPTVASKDLSSEPLVLLSRALAPDSFHQIEELFVRAGAVMNVAHELENLMSMINFVAMGTGCGVVPDHTRAIRRKGVVYRPLRAPNLIRRLAIIKKKGHGDLAELFYRFTIENLARLRGFGQ